MFDSYYYYRQDPQLSVSGINPLTHFVLCGGLQGKRPHRWFDSSWYLSSYPDVHRDGVNPLVHFIIEGAEAGFNPHPGIDIDSYVLQHEEFTGNRLQACIHLLNSGNAFLKEHARAVGRASTNNEIYQGQPAAFGLHIPKVAGSTLLESFRQIVTEDRIYQNTSLFDNIRLNRPEFFELNTYDHIVLYWGHHIHEEMLRAACLAPSYGRKSERPFILFTGLREPIARTRSDLAFNMRLAADFNRSFEPEEFIGELGDRMCKTIVDCFPTLCGDHGELWERAARGLSYFDLVYTSDTLAECFETVCKFIWIKPGPLKTSNVSESADVEEADRLVRKLGDSIAAQMPNDIKLFQWATDNLPFAKQVTKLSEGGGWERTLRALGPFRES